MVPAAARLTIRGLQACEHVEWASVGHPRRYTGHVERRAVDLDWQQTGLSIGHPTDTKTGIELLKGVG